MQTYSYCTSCVDSTSELVDKMTDSPRKVTYKTMQKHCQSLDLLERELGYHSGYPINKDYAVSFWKSSYDGKPCYYLEHSRIWYIFTAC